ncbi:MAG: HDOD domain-containing protein [Deltaproteobacteria bacterium]|nr:HDOD domain-containing protein [Deltaproteobacteria bacterium]
MIDLKVIIGNIGKLKPLPQVANRIMELAADPKSSLAELSEVISYDQALTANLLRVCNSTYFGLSRQIESIHQAVLILGMDQVVDLILLSGAAENLKNVEKGYDLSKGDLWRYSVASAILARDIAERKGIRNNHMIFTAALLKDIGKAVLADCVAESFEQINRLVTEQGMSFREAEKQAIGIDHAELGAMIALKWKFSPKMVAIIKNHHPAVDASYDYDLETCIIHLADILCMTMGIGVGADGLAYRFNQEMMAKLGFSERNLFEIIAAFGEKLQQVEELISLS